MEYQISFSSKEMKILVFGCFEKNLQLILAKNIQKLLRKE